MMTSSRWAEQRWLGVPGRVAPECLDHGLDLGGLTLVAVAVLTVRQPGSQVDVFSLFQPQASGCNQLNLLAHSVFSVEESS